MRQKLLASAAIMIGAAFAVPASAEITVFGTVVYDKAVAESEVLVKVKTVTLVVSVAVAGTSAAESNAITNQRIGAVPAQPATQFTPARPASGGPNVHSYIAGPLGARLGVDYFATTQNSVTGNVGITQFNQDVGTGSNQANVLSAAMGRNAFFAEANNAAEQWIGGESVTEAGFVSAGVVRSLRVSEMTASVNSNTGVTMVNQNSGVFNNQSNAASLALGLDTGAVAMAKSDLGQWNTGNTTVETNVRRSGTITNSGNLNRGIVAGNQATGYMANQANMFSVSATVPNNASVNAGFNAFAGSITPNF